MLVTYHQVTAPATDAAWAVETTISRDWARDHLDPAAVEARRQGILERGRAQQ